MPFIVLGINHKSAPVEMREKVAFSPDSLVHALQACPQQAQVDEVVILSTCNRTEIYANLDASISFETSTANLQTWLADFHNISLDLLKTHSYVKLDQDAMTHLMSVACGLDSLIMGEPQILGQVKQAFSEAKHAGVINTPMERLFDASFSVAKRVRTETDIGANAVSVAFASVQLAKQIFGDLSRSSVLLIGAGETIDLVAKHLLDANTKHISVANRTLANAQRLASSLDGEAITISQIPEHLGKADVVISSTASSLPLIGQGMVANALKVRRHKPMLLVDLAVPRDIEAEVNELDDAFLYTVDDLQNIVQQNVANRESAALQAQEMIASQVSRFLEWQETYKRGDLIKIYRSQSELSKQDLVEKALKQISDGNDVTQVIESLAFKLSKNLMHGPTKALQLAAKNRDADALDVLVQALDIEANSSNDANLPNKPKR